MYTAPTWFDPIEIVHKVISGMTTTRFPRSPVVKVINYFLSLTRPSIEMNLYILRGTFVIILCLWGVPQVNSMSNMFA
jgi:hypothetical protein